MHWHNIGLILIAGLNFGTALLVWLRNPKNKINISFTLALLAFGAWSFGEAMFREAIDESSAFFWSRFEQITGSFIPVFFFLFTFYFPFQRRLLKSFEKILIILSMIVLYLIIFSPIYLLRVYLEPHNNDFYLHPVGRIYYFLFISFYAIISFYLLAKKYFVNQGILKKNILKIIFASSFAGVLSTFFGITIPLIFGHDNPWFAAYFSLPTIILLVYFIIFADKEISVR